MKKGTIKNWAAHATPGERDRLALLAGTSPAYLFQQLAQGHRENPKLRLALAIIAGAEQINKRRKVKLPEITLAGLAYGDE